MTSEYNFYHKQSVAAWPLQLDGILYRPTYGIKAQPNNYADDAQRIYSVSQKKSPPEGS